MADQPVIRRLLGRSPIIPVLTIEALDDAVPLARALVKGGIAVLEITLRSEVALEALRRVRDGVADATVGIGTVVQAEDLERAQAAGAMFAVSPGLTLELARKAALLDLPYLPGVATASEVLAARAEGLTTLKFFPAEPAGGIRALEAFRPVFPDVAFCPTGGVTADNFRRYLALSNVVAVGGSWLAPPEDVLSKEWPAITARAAAAIDRARPPA
jgi:2-dehydro-3-deoxyphosphogluconate aldolase/(4S)-4-hydroxy-2-oxoglutarate aldolase